jgi:hypothetical protein
MKIAIIGSGISALYLAYKLKNKKNYQIDIYEKNNIIGGRIKVVKFENIDVVAGAGILRLKKDKLMYNLCSELKVKMNIYKNKFSYTFENPLNILEIIERLKENLKFFNERDKINFSRYAKSILGLKEYNKFVLSCGLSDFEKADVIDTIYDYGFDDCVSGYEAVSVRWNDLLNSLYKILKNDIHLSTPIKRIKHTEDGKFIIKNIIYDKVIISTNIDVIREYFFKDKIYKNINGQSFVRLYVKLNKPILGFDRIIITKTPFQKIIEINKEKCIYMISYCDNKVANKWKQVVNIKKVVKENLKKIFGIEFKVLKYKLIYWKLGTHYFKPLPNEYKNRDDFLKEAQNPRENMFIIGEGFSRNQGWTEGSLESVDKIINLI